MSKKIFFIINTLQGGGAERVVSTLARRLHELDYQVSIVCLNAAQSVYPLPPDLKIIYLVDRKGDHPILRIYYATQLFLKLSYLLLTKRPDCTISFMTTANLWTGFSSLFTQTRYIVSERTSPDQTIHLYGKLLQWVCGIVYGNAKATVVPSKGIEDCLKKNSNFKTLNNYKVIHNPITNQANFITPYKVSNYKFILAAGRLSYEKGFDLLIKAFKNADLPRNVRLLIVGQGPEEGNLMRQINIANLQDRVKLLGFKKDVYNYYSQAEFFVLSSRNEGYPNALIEAMSMGCACIAMDCQFGPSEIIENYQNGLLVKDGDVYELSKAINLLFNDAELKGKLARNAQLINKTNNLDHITSQWEAII
ncbi:MAG TPA: glycosyltransferase family 4 protein [Pelobium sp.]|nr:glycosyltransferase family 4 protein [Pelobium sp.]